MTNQTETAILAGGCFWGMQDLLRRYPGVLQTRVGYSGGDVPNATYRNHGNHAEAIEIVFDPAVISYRQILEFFFQIHDPARPTARATTLAPATVRRFTTSANSNATWRKTPPRMWMPRGCGQAV